MLTRFRPGLLLTLLMPLLGLIAYQALAKPESVQTLNPDKRIGQLELVDKDGTFEVRLDKEGQALSPEEFFDLLSKQQNRQKTNVLFLVFNITSWFNLVWILVGLLGQVCFSGRMLVQWIMSEKMGRSVVPVAFWWMSLGGASMLILYFIWRKDIIGVLGQSTGFVIYLRNLKLIYRERRLATEVS